MEESTSILEAPGTLQSVLLQTHLKDKLLAREYFQEMSKRDRLVIIYDGDVAIGLCSYFLLLAYDQIERFHRNKTDWQVVDDYDNGEYIFVDHLQTRA